MIRMDDLQLFRGGDFTVNDKLTIRHPTLGEICDYGEEGYWDMVTRLCGTASDFKVFLNDKLHLDFTTVSDFEMFKLVCGAYSKDQVSILFGDCIDFSEMYLQKRPEIDEVVLVDVSTGLVIDESIYYLMVDYLRRIHMIERHFENPGTEYTKKWMIDKARKMQMRQQDKKFESAMVPMISSLVNCEHFKYKHSEVWDLPIYTFMDSVRRIQKIKNCDHLIQGIYSGNVDSKQISSDSLNWLGAL